MKKQAHRTVPFSVRLLATTAIIGIAAITQPGGASAAGFAIKEQSSTAQGNSFAGATAGAEDISYMFFNPAGLVRHDGNQAATVLSYIVVKSETTDATGLLGSSPTEDAGGSVLVPAIYGMWSVTPDLKIGLGINAPFGLKTEYSRTWAGQLEAVETDLRTININPVVAYRVNEMILVGAGLQIQHAEATLSQMMDGEDNDPFDGLYVPVLSELTGDDWGYGFTLGLLVDFSESTRLGFGYRSKIDHTLAGDFTIAGGVIDTATADLATPAQATAGFYHDLSDRLAIMGEIAWTQWSSFDEIRVVGDNIGLIGVTPENWEDVWFYSIGATWSPTEKLKVRSGVAFDQSPIPEEFRTARIPGADRTWVSAGLNYQFSPGFVIDAAYTHVFVDDAAVTGLTFTATYENSVDILVLQGTFRF